MNTRWWMVCAIGAACAAGCKKNDRWMQTRATQLHVGALEVDIPTGWRDINELNEKPAKMPPAGARAILPEQPGMGRILVMPVPFKVAGEECEKVGAAWQAQAPADFKIEGVEGANFNGSPGCMMKLIGKGSGKIRIVTPPGGSTVAVACLGYTQDVDDACDKVVYGLKVTAAK